MKTYLKAEDIAKVLNISVRSVYDRKQLIGGMLKLGRSVRFDPDKFNNWLEEGGQSLKGGWKNEVEG